MFYAMVISSVITALTITIHFEVLVFLGRLRAPISPRFAVIAGVFLIFVAHVVEIWLFAGGLYLVNSMDGLGSLEGEFKGTVQDYLYFSTVTYTTLGYGDVIPTGQLRTICGFEAVTGLLMMAWSAAFTVFHIQNRWT